MVSNSRASKKRPSYPVAFSCYQCAVKIMATPAEALRAVEDHVNLWHPTIVGPGVKPGARNVTPSSATSLGITAGTPPG